MNHRCSADEWKDLNMCVRMSILIYCMTVRHVFVQQSAMHGKKSQMFLNLSYIVFNEQNAINMVLNSCCDQPGLNLHYYVSNDINRITMPMH